jgi:hypothetical protein
MASLTFQRLARLGWTDRALLVEAMVTLALASLAIKVVPFRRVVGAAAAFGRPERPDAESDLLIRKIVWWVNSAAKRVPWRAVCFQRGLAVHVMLRRRGIASFLHYGVAQSDSLKAHVWVSAAGRDVIGGEEAAGFTRLATYPPAAA